MGEPFETKCCVMQQKKRNTISNIILKNNGDGATAYESLLTMVITNVTTTVSNYSLSSVMLVLFVLKYFHLYSLIGSHVIIFR